VTDDEVAGAGAPDAGQTWQLPPVPRQPDGGDQPTLHERAYGYSQPVDPFWPPVQTDPSLEPVYVPVPMVAPPRRRRWRTLLIVLAIVLPVCCVGGVLLVVTSPLLTGPVASTAGLNTPVRDGKFEFVVGSASCGHPAVSHGPLNRHAQGQFCLVAVTVRNVGDRAQTFADSNQKAHGPDGTTYSADSGAGLIINTDSSAMWNLINPGNSVAAVVVYDIPTSARIVSLELHDSGLSRGVVVSLD
jgi:hypothetical protein